MTDDQPIDAVPAVTHQLRGHRASDLAAFTEFYHRFTPKLIRFLQWQGAGIVDAAEIVQDTMSQAWNSWSDIRFPEAWTKMVAGRAYVRRYASVKEDPVAALPERSALLPDDLDIAAFEQRHDVLRGLAKLPRRQRQVMAWTLAEHTPIEIAEILQITPEAVRSNLLKARRSLAIHMSEEER